MWMASHTLNGAFARALFLAAVIVSYVGGLAIFRHIYLSLVERTLQLFAPMITVTFLAADYLTFMDPMAKLKPMCLLSAAYGIINTIGNDIAGTTCFVLTGHLAQITNAFVDQLSSANLVKRPLCVASIIQSSSVFFGFIFGAFAAWSIVKFCPNLKDRGLLSLMGTIYGALFLHEQLANYCMIMIIIATLLCLFFHIVSFFTASQMSLFRIFERAL